MKAKTKTQIPRLYVEPSPGAFAPGAVIGLDAAHAHYLKTVMRLGRGDRVLLFNGEDGEYRGEIAEYGKKSAHITLMEQTRPQVPLPSLMLLFAPVKKNRFDFIVEKATELGAGIIRPVITGRTNASRVNQARMKSTAIEAAEQTGRLTIPQILAPVPLVNLLAQWDEGRHIVFCDESRAADGSDTMAGRIRAIAGKPVAILIGPEGGFTQDERARLGEMKNTLAVSLGGNILRADTAAVAALSIWQAVAGEWGDHHGG